jgi:hypothetical protein
MATQEPTENPAATQAIPNFEIPNLDEICRQAAGIVLGYSLGTEDDEALDVAFGLIDNDDAIDTIEERVRHMIEHRGGPDENDIIGLVSAFLLASVRVNQSLAHA